jgi:hypothetical protein
MTSKFETAAAKLIRKIQKDCNVSPTKAEDIAALLIITRLVETEAFTKEALEELVKLYDSINSESNRKN